MLLQISIIVIVNDVISFDFRFCSDLYLNNKMKTKITTQSEQFERSWVNEIFDVIVPQYMNITTKFSTSKLLFFSFSSCLTIERSIVFKTMDRQCESFSRIFSSATGLDKSFIFIRNTQTSSSINSETSKRYSETENGKVCLVNWPGFRRNYRLEGLLKTQIQLSVCRKRFWMIT